jgi:hypothetical protein
VGACVLALPVAAVLLAASALAAEPEGASAGARGERGGLSALPGAVRQALEEDGIALAPGRDAGDGRVTGYVVFDAPVEIAFLLLSQTERQTEYRRELKEVRRLAVDGLTRIDAQRIRVLFVSLRYDLEYTLDPEAYRITWRLAPGREHQLEHVSGSWQLEPLGLGRTLARFETRVRVGKGLPTMFQDMATRSKVPTTLEASMEWVNEEAEPLVRSRALSARQVQP